LSSKRLGRFNSDRHTSILLPPTVQIIVGEEFYSADPLGW